MCRYWLLFSSGLAPGGSGRRCPVLGHYGGWHFAVDAISWLLLSFEKPGRDVGCRPSCSCLSLVCSHRTPPGALREMNSAVVESTFFQQLSARLLASTVRAEQLLAITTICRRRSRWMGHIARRRVPGNGCHERPASRYSRYNSPSAPELWWGLRSINRPIRLVATVPHRARPKTLRLSLNNLCLASRLARASSLPRPRGECSRAYCIRHGCALSRRACRLSHTARLRPPGPSRKIPRCCACPSLSTTLMAI
ncbi:hypothetical protein K491DRAFT_395914 [Lophiostoma macrostomum CBS 122681]|uniref:Uncharacterized protein n=1 Tax=Lophiostoma macrostomum CBS 122681 TaxID=1314788 RepID=A0A6A6TC35_9PLEO|nr:hypothetical protein K491DRAFT_395914 [Lophiostoma macrostomum CBS 122681]